MKSRTEYETKMKYSCPEHPNAEKKVGPQYFLPGIRAVVRCRVCHKVLGKA